MLTCQEDFLSAPGWQVSHAVQLWPPTLHYLNDGREDHCSLATHRYTPAKLSPRRSASGEDDILLRVGQEGAAGLIGTAEQVADRHARLPIVGQRDRAIGKQHPFLLADTDAAA
jgi:hypothetical protein